MFSLNLLKILILLGVLKNFASSKSTPIDITKDPKTFGIISLLFDSGANNEVDVEQEFNPENELIIDINPREDVLRDNFKNPFKSSNEFVQYVKKFLQSDRKKQEAKINNERNLLDIINPRLLNEPQPDVHNFQNPEESDESSIQKRVISKVIEVIKNIKKSSGWNANTEDKQEGIEQNPEDDKKEHHEVTEKNDVNFWNKIHHNKIPANKAPVKQQPSNYIVKQTDGADDLKKFLQQITLKEMNKKTPQNNDKLELNKTSSNYSWLYLTKDTIDIAKKKKNPAKNEIDKTTTVPKFYFKSVNDVENTFPNEHSGNDESENNEKNPLNKLAENNFMQIQGKSLLESNEIESEELIGKVEKSQESKESSESQDNIEEVKIKNSSNEIKDDSVEDILVMNYYKEKPIVENKRPMLEQVSSSKPLKCDSDDKLCSSLTGLENILDNSIKNHPSDNLNFDLTSIITETPVSYVVYEDDASSDESDSGPIEQENDVNIVNLDSEDVENESIFIKSYPSEAEEINVDEDDYKILNVEKHSDSDETVSLENDPNEINSESRAFRNEMPSVFIDDNNINALNSLEFQDEKSYIPAATTAEELVSLIPVIVTRYRDGFVSELEEETYQKMFSEVWPLIIQEAKRLPHEPINPIMKSLLEINNLIK